MKTITIIFLFITGFFLTSNGQQLNDSSKIRLPYFKQKGMVLAYVSFTGFAVYVPSTGLKHYMITAVPRYGYYLSPKFEVLGEYAISFYKPGNASTITKTFHQFAVTGRYFPFNKYNFIHLEAGLQTGNYTTSKPERDIIDVWSNNAILGFGIEVLPRKRKYVLDFNVRYVIPFNPNYKFDFVRLLGFGVTIK